MKVTYDISRPPYQRVVDVIIPCSDCTTQTFYPLDDSHVYKIALSSYLRNGGDAYAVIKDNIQDYTIGK